MPLRQRDLEYRLYPLLTKKNVLSIGQKISDDEAIVLEIWEV